MYPTAWRSPGSINPDVAKCDSAIVSAELLVVLAVTRRAAAPSKQDAGQRPGRYT